MTGREEFEIRSLLSGRLQEEGERNTWTRILHITNSLISGENPFSCTDEGQILTLTDYGTLIILLNRVARDKLNDVKIS